MTTSTDKLDILLEHARAAAKKLFDELEYSLELVREEESVEVDLHRLVLDWNRSRTELALAVFGKPGLPAGGLQACETAIASRQRFAEVERQTEQAKAELRYLEQSPAGLMTELSDLIAVKREQVQALEVELAEITPPVVPQAAATAKPTPAPASATPKPKGNQVSAKSASQPASKPAAKPGPKPNPKPASRPGISAQPKRCEVCQETPTRGHLKHLDNEWCCRDCGRLKETIASARRALAALNARPLEQSVSSTGEVPGVASIRAEGREAMHALASRRRKPGKPVPMPRATSRSPMTLFSDSADAADHGY